MHPLFRLLLILLSALPLVAQSAPASRPNILFIMSDDHASHAISAYGSRINRTPHIDRLAREGMLFRNCFVVNSICSPSRAAILTGKYSHKNGVPAFNRFDGSQPHVARYLRDAGYQTALIGKWHLGSEPTAFDHWIVLPGQGAYHNPVLLDSSGRRNFQGYVSDVITDLAVEFLTRRDAGKPFFMMVHHKAPHRPWEPSARHASLYEDVEIPEPETLRDDYATRTDAARQARMTIADDLTRRDLKLAPPRGLSGPDLQRWLNATPKEVIAKVNGTEQVLSGESLRKWKYQRYIKDYLRCVASVDDSVGRLLEQLDRLGLSHNTLVVYTSDQGFFLGDHGWYDKRFMYEESLRMPFLVRWPQTINAGSTQNSMALNVDFAPTFMEIAGLVVPGDIQGRSLLPLLKGRTPQSWRKEMYYRYYHDPGDHNTRAHYGLRTETHKLIHFWKLDQWECYDLRQDPKELRNLAGLPEHRKLVDRLKVRLAQAKKAVDDRDEYAHELPAAGVAGQSFPKAPTR
ncbi:MAG: sulfatase [Verrucomicrobia bacterium]|nr:sulfatase [Verrucomicrobiota bacterium]